MTAPEPTPTAEHIDAVALSIGCRVCGNGPRRMCPIRTSSGLEADGLHAYRHLDAQTLLTSTDPAVHAAMLDALVRAGVLTEEDAPIYRGAEHHHWQQRWDGEHTHEGGRYVTPWEVAP